MAENHRSAEGMRCRVMEDPYEGLSPAIREGDSLFAAHFRL